MHGVYPYGALYKCIDTLDATEVAAFVMAAAATSLLLLLHSLVGAADAQRVRISQSRSSGNQRRMGKHGGVEARAFVATFASLFPPSNVVRFSPPCAYETTS